MLGAFIFVVAAIVIVGITARHLIHPLSTGKGGLTSALTKINQNNGGVVSQSGTRRYPVFPEPAVLPA